MKRLGWLMLLIFIFVFAGYGLYRFFSSGIHSISTGEIGGIVFFVLVLLYFIIKTIADTKKTIKENKDKEVKK
jgi:hypothetical protein